MKAAESNGTDGEHVVKIYEDESDLIEAVDAFVGPSLSAGEAAIVIARQSNLDALEARLEQRGIDLGKAREGDRYIALEAAQTLSKILVDGRPDRSLFTKTVGELIRRAARANRNIKVFGEMVALLWEAGSKTSAIRLERFWNELGKCEPFSLLCAYPKQSFDVEGGLRALFDICREHSHVISAGDACCSAPAYENGHDLIDVIRRKSASVPVPAADASFTSAGQAICGSI